MNNVSVGIHFRYVLAITLVHMRSNSVNSASGRKTVVNIGFSDFLSISYKRGKIVAI